MDSVLRKRRYVVAALAVWLTASVPALASPIIIGSLSNFDVYNQTDDDCHGFEIEMEDVTPDDVYSLYNPWGYQTSITPFAGGTRVVYDGIAPANDVVVTPGGLKHYGVHLSTSPTTVRYNWLANNGGVLVHAPIANPAPVQLPTPVWVPGVIGIAAGVWNNTDRPIWLKALHAPNDSPATLEDLLIDSDDVMALGEEPEDIEAQLLDPDDVLSEVEDLLDASDASGRAIFWVYPYTGEVDDSGTAVGEPEFANTHGEAIGTVMTAVNFAVVPEPATALLFALTLLGLSRRVRSHDRN
jgi:hypothetical protein